MTNTITPQDFVAKWRRADVKERSAYQEHFIDLCHLVGSPTPIEDDPKGERFMFEAGATRQAGGEVIGHGWADVWKKGFFAFEYKGKHADLDKAYAQLQQYRESLQNPPLLIVCDLNNIVIHTNFTNMVKKVYTITLDDLLTPAGLDTLKAAFFNPDALKSNKTAADVTQDAAKEFATLADLLRKYGTEPQKAAHFLIRMLFCLFAEDVGLLQKHLIKTMVAQSRSKPGLMTQQLKQLFGAMASGGYFGPIQILHFNGGLFDSEEALDLDSDSLDVLSKISEFDWSSVEPTIFGTLFERSLDPSKRSQLGAHYTDKGDILLVVEPVLMIPLRRRWAEVKAEAIELAKKRDAAKGRAKTKPADELKRLILGFADEIAKMKVLDPACGSGNFLYVSLRLLLDLEKEVITLAGDLDVGRFFPSVHPKQLHGIEINEYAFELAQITIWIGYIQWLRENGFGFPPEPILQHLKNVSSQ
ncbi:MAG: class I SAM-dependent DNA methyltransferase [Chloroflexi bacterium]|nr:class I SAM-dependent DNA methyltransferase [Chloroflexota bacterium]